MTKKSPSRLERDAAAQGRTKFSDRLTENQTNQAKIKAYLDNNTCWDDVNAIGAQMATMMLSYSFIGQVMANELLINEIDNNPDLAHPFSVSTVVFSRELRSLKEELMAINRDHADRRGAATSMDDNAEGIKIYQRYVAFKERHDANLLPLYTKIVECTEAAEKALQDRQLNVTPELTAQVAAMAGHLEKALMEEAGLNPDQDPGVITDVVPLQ